MYRQILSKYRNVKFRENLYQFSIFTWDRQTDCLRVDLEVHHLATFH
jgi:hypothetical protein